LKGHKIEIYQTSTTLLMTTYCNKLQNNEISKFAKHNNLHLFYCHFIKKLNSFNRGLSLTVTLSVVEGLASSVKVTL